jgi:hypothetical protein
MLDEYYGKEIGLIDLTYVGNNSPSSEKFYICEFCNVALPEKKPSTSNSLMYMKYICRRCANVKDVELSNIEATTDLKHGEIQNRTNLKTLDLEAVQR